METCPFKLPFPAFNDDHLPMFQYFLVPLMSEPSFAGGLDDLNGLSDGWTVLVALFLFFSLSSQ